MEDYKEKYLKYKTKYLELKAEILEGGLKLKPNEAKLVVKLNIQEKSPLYKSITDFLDSFNKDLKFYEKEKSEEDDPRGDRGRGDRGRGDRGRGERGRGERGRGERGRGRGAPIGAETIVQKLEIPLTGGLGSPVADAVPVADPVADAVPVADPVADDVSTKEKIKKPRTFDIPILEIIYNKTHSNNNTVEFNNKIKDLNSKLDCLYNNRSINDIIKQIDIITNLIFDIINDFKINDFKIIQKFTFDDIFMQYICQIRDAICIHLFGKTLYEKKNKKKFNKDHIFFTEDINIKKTEQNIEEILEEEQKEKAVKDKKDEEDKDDEDEEDKDDEDKEDKEDKDEDDNTKSYLFKIRDEYYSNKKEIHKYEYTNKTFSIYYNNTLNDLFQTSHPEKNKEVEVIKLLEQQKPELLNILKTIKDTKKIKEENIKTETKDKIEKIKNTDQQIQNLEKDLTDLLRKATEEDKDKIKKNFYQLNKNFYEPIHKLTERKYLDLAKLKKETKQKIEEEKKKLEQNKKEFEDTKKNIIDFLNTKYIKPKEIYYNNFKLSTYMKNT